MTGKRPVTIRGSQLPRALAPLRDELGKSNRDRLDILLRLFPADTDRITLGDCLDRLFPGPDIKKQQDSLRQFREDLNKAAASVHVAVTFCVDTKKRNAPSDRFVWFEGEDAAIAQTEIFSKDSTSDMRTDTLVPQRALSTTGSELEDKRRRVALLLCYSDHDADLKAALLDRLAPLLAVSKSYRYEVRELTNSCADWPTVVADAAKACDFVVPLVSAHFLSDWRDGVRSIASARVPLIPVALSRIQWDRMDFQGLQRIQTFQHKGRSFAELSGTIARDEFVHELFKSVEDRLDNHFASLPAVSPERPARARYDAFIEDALDHDLLDDEALKRWEPSKALVAALSGLEDKDAAPGENAHGEDAVGLLTAWALHENSEPFCAVLGEYGIGKTTTLKRFTQEMLARRKSNPSVPLPIFVDLRHYVEKSDSARDNPTLRDILKVVIERNWLLEDPSSVTPDDIIRLVREERAIIIFDGLDEKIVHLRPPEAQAFIRELWSILLPFKKGQKSGKFILSCRSHYFKDVWSQNAMLSGEDRQGVKRADYRAFVMLPFTETQIRSYLEKVVGPDRVDPVMELFTTVHNLRELASRPYLLSILSEHVADLERYRAGGRPVRAVDVYEFVVRRWLNRDMGKHQFTESDKRILMERLAAALTADGAREWPWEKVETWLRDFLADNERFASRYRDKERDVMDEDLRTATFILRPDAGEGRMESFRFAHTSLQEYFLARYLKRALDENRPDDWRLPMVSLETLDFLGEMLAGDKSLTAIRTLEGILSEHRERATLLAFRYWLRAAEKDWPEPSPAKVDLHGEDMSRWTIVGRSALMPLSLAGADLSRAVLDEADLRFVNLGGSCLDGACFLRAALDHVSLHSASAEQADFTGTTWWECDLRGLAASDTRLWDAHLSRCDASAAHLPLGHDLWGAWPDAAEDASRPAGAVITTRLVHRDPVLACAWSPDGRRIVSGSSDHTLRVWDAESGRSVMELKGHSYSVNACAWSPDGRRIVLGSSDHTLRVWDADTGSLLAVFYPLPSGQSCAYDEVSNRFLSASPLAWRYINWLAWCPLRKSYRAYPAEYFARLPID